MQFIYAKEKNKQRQRNFMHISVLQAPEKYAMGS